MENEVMKEVVFNTGWLIAIYNLMGKDVAEKRLCDNLSGVNGKLVAELYENYALAFGNN